MAIRRSVAELVNEALIHNVEHSAIGTGERCHNFFRLMRLADYERAVRLIGYYASLLPIHKGQLPFGSMRSTPRRLIFAPLASRREHEGAIYF